MEKKQLTMIATNTMPDLVFSGVKWFAYSTYKGAFYALDDFIKTDDPGIDDFFKDAIENSKFDGKIYALPFEFNTGNTNIIIYNKDMVAAKGVAEPKDDWTFEEFAQSATQLTDTSAKVWGTNLLTTNYYDLATWARSLGGDILSEDGKEFTLASDEKTVEATRWQVELRTKHKAAPSRAEAEGLAFPAGQLAFFATGIYSPLGIGKTVADKFKWDVVLAPVGPNGQRGYEAFTTMYSMSAKSKAPEAAYQLLKYMTGPDTAKFAFLEQGQPPARQSIWLSEEAQKLNPIWGRAAKWISETTAEGPFPMPYNLRFSELQDKFGNLIQPVLYGETGFDEGIKQVQTECQPIVALPRG
jgi:multiple sugar transport system substrate-binding protein